MKNANKRKELEDSLEVANKERESWCDKYEKLHAEADANATALHKNDLELTELKKNLNILSKHKSNLEAQVSALSEAVQDFESKVSTLQGEHASLLSEKKVLTGNISITKGK